MRTQPIQVPLLEEFCDENLITDVLGPLQTGKEATVYCCRAHPSTGAELLAAKVYRPLAYRSFRDDALYQEGRVIVDRRLRRAYRKKTRTGRQVQFGLWVEHEFETLKMLHAAGADVPRPVARSGPAILMEYVGDAESAAPLLKSVSLARGEARVLFDVVRRNVELFLACNRVHADLSAFNILYWQECLKIIDFPQAVDPRFNRNASGLLMRDIENVCQYFERCGVRGDASRLARDLWRRFMKAEL
jgi:RIO kinase 1